MYRFWRLRYRWPDEALATWRVREEVLAQGRDFLTVRYTTTTPEGDITWRLEVGGDQVNTHEHPVKDERDLDLVETYLPAPEALAMRERHA